LKDRGRRIQERSRGRMIDICKQAADEGRLGMRATKPRKTEGSNSKEATKTKGTVWENGTTGEKNLPKKKPFGPNIRRNSEWSRRSSRREGIYGGVGRRKYTVIGSTGWGEKELRFAKNTRGEGALFTKNQIKHVTARKVWKIDSKNRTRIAN